MPLQGRILRRMLLTTLGPTAVAGLVAASLSLVPIMVAAAPIGPETVVTVRSPVGFPCSPPPRTSCANTAPVPSLPLGQ